MITSGQLNRRDLFEWGTQGLGATALLAMLRDDGLVRSAAAATDPAGWKTREPVARRAIHICLVGGMSHIDSFDYKPELKKFHGKSLTYDKQPDIFFGQVGLLRQNDWEFKPRGESGLMVSELFPRIAELADELCVLKSMVSNSANHTPALFVQNSGFESNGFPAMGSWLSYGLGSETNELPSYVVLPDGRGGPNGGATNWSNGFLPAQYQGVVFRGGDQPVRDLFPATALGASTDAATRQFINSINRQQLERAGYDPALAARIRSYELAARMQLSIPRVSDVSGETEQTQQAYGITEEQTADMGRRCLLGRRLLERGVRFVQLYSGGPIAGSPRASWDAHESVKDNHGIEAGRIDKPVAALLADLKQRGMLQDTLVLFTTEFGRTPFSQSGANNVGPGRDHNRYGFSCWLAGAGIKGGTAIGATDDVGWKATERPIPWHDFHATLLHQFGIDHERLTHYHNGIQRRLTNVHGDIVEECLA
ncbi:MAG: DUF1501 domain-containing protein [Planctomycetota bacterium]|nr:DUF1501 domain-containing protein [Planctomycetota bacterium]